MNCSRYHQRYLCINIHVYNQCLTAQFTTQCIFVDSAFYLTKTLIYGLPKREKRRLLKKFNRVKWQFKKLDFPTPSVIKSSASSFAIQ